MFNRYPIYFPFIAFCAGCLFFSQHSFSQGLYNESNLYINGTSIYVDGEIVNDGKLENDGLIAFTGDWKSAGKYNGQGSLEISGNAPQRISHYNQPVETLVINGWGSKYIKGAISVKAGLNLKTGIVEISSQDALQLNAGVIVTGGSDKSYIDGALTVEGDGYKFFPVGKNGTYAPIEFLNVQSLSARYSVEVFENAPATSIDNIIVRKALYWFRKDIEGSFGSSKVAIDFDKGYFENPDNIILVAGTSFQEPFNAITDLTRSTETNKISTNVSIASPIIMLGEISEKWTEADFYFSTALSPHALHAGNQQVKIFGERLSSDQFRFQVFNRWGDAVYESTSLEEMSTNGWDGRTISGGALMSGSYPYRLTAFDKTGRKFEKKGVITIVN